jgi:hypothetical protein
MLSTKSGRSSRSSRKRARECTWEEVFIPEESNPVPQWAQTPEHFLNLPEVEKDNFLTHIGEIDRKGTIIQRVNDCLKRKPLPSPSDTKWHHVDRILEGPLPKAEALPRIVDEECAVGDEFITIVKDVLCENFRNLTEAEAVMFVGQVVLCAVKNLKVQVQMEPSIRNHPTFTDFSFVLKISGREELICIIEVKKIAVHPNLAFQTDFTAQSLREAQIMLEGADENKKFPLILTNGAHWSFGTAEKSTGGLIKLLSVQNFLLMTLEDWKIVISYLKSIINGR